MCGKAAFQCIKITFNMIVNYLRCFSVASIAVSSAEHIRFPLKLFLNISFIYSRTKTNPSMVTCETLFAFFVADFNHLDVVTLRHFFKFM